MVGRMPWEKMYIGGDEDKIEGVPETVEMPQKEIESVNSKRQMILKVFNQDCRSNTIDEWKRVAKKHKETFKRHDKTWDLEDTFLQECFTKVVTEKIENKTLSFFPAEEEGADRDIGKVLKQIEQLKITPAVVCLGQPMLKALNAVEGFLIKLQEGHVAYTESDFLVMSTFQRRVVNASAAFVCMRVEEKQVRSSPYFGKKHVFGRLALEYGYQKVQASEAKNALRTLESPVLKDLKMFKFYLSVTTQNHIKSLLKVAYQMHKTKLLGGCIEDKKDDELGNGEAEVPVLADSKNAEATKKHKVGVKKLMSLMKPASLASSSSAEVKLTPSQANKQKAAFQKKASKAEEGLSKLFGKKAIVDVTEVKGS